MDKPDDDGGKLLVPRQTHRRPSIFEAHGEPGPRIFGCRQIFWRGRFDKMGSFCAGFSKPPGPFIVEIPTKIFVEQPHFLKDGSLREPAGRGREIIYFENISIRRDLQLGR